LQGSVKVEGWLTLRRLPMFCSDATAVTTNQKPTERGLVDVAQTSEVRTLTERWPVANLLGQLLGPSLGQFLPPKGGHNVLYSGGSNNLELRRNNVNF
jgi:hypothetical protein